MHLGLIGFGNIAASLLALPLAPPVSRISVLVRPGGYEAAQARALQTGGALVPEVVASLDALLAARPDLVVECAGHGAVEAFGPAVLEAGCDLVVVSVGALADATLAKALERAGAAPSSGRLICPIGAIGGLDLLATLAPAGDLEVTYTGTKPPAAWRGTPAEQALDLAALRAPVRFFAGSAREAALHYPKNANVVAALALAGAGFEATRVELVADPGAAGNTHAYSVVSPICRYRIEIAAMPSPDNPRTSATTAWSVLSEIRRQAQTGRGTA